MAEFVVKMVMHFTPEQKERLEAIMLAHGFTEIEDYILYLMEFEFEHWSDDQGEMR